MKKIISSFLLIIFSTSLFGNIESTRNVLDYFCHSNSETLKVYDKLTSDCSDFAQKSEKWDFDKLLAAVEYSAEKHKGQQRKNPEKTPYIYHPLSVTYLLWETGKIRSLNVLIAALLHDTLEDTDATEEEILEKFGSRVLYTVKEVTNAPDLSSYENKVLQVQKAPNLSLDGQLVKLADRVHNITDLSENPPATWTPEQVDAYHEWGKRLLEVLIGTNQGLEQRLQHLLMARTTKNITQATALGLIQKN